MKIKSIEEWLKVRFVDISKLKKHEKPRCAKQIKSLPVRYRVNKND